MQIGFKVLAILLILLTGVFYPVLFAKNIGSGFTFNPEAEYWPTTGWRFSSPEQQGMSSEELSGVFDEIKTKHLSFKSLVIVRNGYIVAEAHRYFPELLHGIYSSTKSVSSALMGIAIDKGHVKGVRQTLLEFFPELSKKNDNGKTGSITVKQLLNMSCGFDWPELEKGYLDFSNPAIEMMKGDTASYILDKPVIQEPGQHYNYNSGCSHLLLLILDRAGLEIATFARDQLFAPLGITSYIWNRDGNGLPNGGYGLDMRARDMAKFGYLFLKGGNWDGRQVISTAWVEESSKKQIRMNWRGFVADDYGYQWYVHPFGFHSLGYKGQYIFVIPDKELVVVFTSDLPRNQLDAPIHLVKSVIIPAVKSDRALPEDAKNLRILRNKSKRFDIY